MLVLEVYTIPFPVKTLQQFRKSKQSENKNKWAQIKLGEENQKNNSRTVKLIIFVAPAFDSTYCVEFVGKTTV